MTERPDGPPDGNGGGKETAQSTALTDIVGEVGGVPEPNASTEDVATATPKPEAGGDVKDSPWLRIATLVKAVETQIVAAAAADATSASAVEATLVRTLRWLDEIQGQLAALAERMPEVDDQVAALMERINDSFKTTDSAGRRAAQAAEYGRVSGTLWMEIAAVDENHAAEMERQIIAAHIAARDRITAHIRRSAGGAVWLVRAGAGALAGWGLVLLVAACWGVWSWIIG